MADGRHRRPSEARRPKAPTAPIAFAVAALVAIVILVGSLAKPAANDEPEDVASEPLAEVARSEEALVADTDAMIEAKARLSATMGELARQNVHAGYYVATLDGQELFSENADETFYGASSIKGPYVLSVFSDGVPASLSGLVEEAIVWSSNEAYWSLRSICGYDALSAQLQSLGVDELSAYQSFVHLTPRQLAGLWIENAPTLLAEGDGVAQLRGYFEDPEHAPIAALGEGCYSKGGWIATEGLHCTVDAGIVEHGEMRYVMAVMIDAGEDDERLAALVGDVDALAQALWVLDPPSAA